MRIASRKAPAKRIWNSPCAVAWLAAAIAPLFLLAAARAGAGPLTLKVDPAVNRSGDKRFDGLLVSEGIANLVAQEFYDTGLFVPIEEKAEISERIGRMGGGNGKAEVDAVARAEIVRVRVSRFRGLFGFVGGARTTTTATIMVSLRIDARPPLTAEGRASATTKAVGTFFEVRNDRIAFDATSTGRMMQDAVHAAIGEIANDLKGKK